MPNLFENVTFAQHKSTYVGAPIEQFAKTADILSKRYEQNQDAMDQLDMALASIPVEKADTPILKARIDRTRELFKSTIDKGDFENADGVVRNAVKEFSMDKGVNAAMENYQVRQKTKQELRNAYDKGELSATQYRDRTDQFNQYEGVGTPDELGFYNKYSFDFGAKRVDLNALASKLSEGFKPDISSGSVESIGYASSKHEAAGIANRSTTVSGVHANGKNIGTVIGLGFMSNPDAMAYIADEVRIHNKYNPDKPITVQQYIDGFTKSYIENETYDQANVDIKAIRDEDAIRQAGHRDAQEQGFSGAESLYTENGYENASLKNMRDFAEEQLTANTSSPGGTYTGGGYNTGFIQLQTRKKVLTPAESQEFNNIKAKVPGKTDKEKTINALTYIKNLQENAKNIQYATYNKKDQQDRTEYLYNNLLSRNIYNISTGEQLKESDKLDIKKDAFQVVGKPEADNAFYDRTNTWAYALGDVAMINGKKYIIGASVDELGTDRGKLGQAINIFTSSRRLGKTVPMFENTTVDYIDTVPEYGNRAAYKITFPDKKVTYINTEDQYGNKLTTSQIYSTYYNLIYPEK